MLPSWSFFDILLTPEIADIEKAGLDWTEVKVGLWSNFFFHIHPLTLSAHPLGTPSWVNIP